MDLLCERELFLNPKMSKSDGLFPRREKSKPSKNDHEPDRLSFAKDDYDHEGLTIFCFINWKINT